MLDFLVCVWSKHHQISLIECLYYQQITSFSFLNYRSWLVILDGFSSNLNILCLNTTNLYFQVHHLLLPMGENDMNRDYFQLDPCMLLSRHCLCHKNMFSFILIINMTFLKNVPNLLLWDCIPHFVLRIPISTINAWRTSSWNLSFSILYIIFWTLDAYLTSLTYPFALYPTHLKNKIKTHSFVCSIYPKSWYQETRVFHKNYFQDSLKKLQSSLNDIDTHWRKREKINN